MQNSKTSSDGLKKREGPLSGVIVLDVTRVVAGPYCSIMLADMGATVIKVENPKDPDYTRNFPPFTKEDGESAFFSQYNRNKLGITLDLKSEDGKLLLKKLVRKAHILVENFRPGAMENLGLGYETLKKENKALIYTAISGFGQTGPKSPRPSFDNTGQAESGLWSMNGYPDRPPVRVGTIIGDLAACFFGTIGTLIALREAEKSGEGQLVDVAQVDSTLCLTESALPRYSISEDEAKPTGNDHAFVRPYEQFSCKDGFVFFGGYNDKQWRETLRVFDSYDLAEDPEIDTMDKRFNKEVYDRRIKPLINGWFSRYTKVELEKMLADKVPLSPIKGISEVIKDEQLLSRDMIIDMPVINEMVKMFGNPIKLSSMSKTKFDRAPDLGGDNENVLKALLGLNNDDITRLKTVGAI
jgi:CoA:oxalate CoA-transferase